MATNTKETKYDRQVSKINQELKESLNCKVRLSIDRQSVYLRYTASGKRKKISPQCINLSTTGIYSARQVAIDIDSAIKLRQYSDQWLEQKVYGKLPETVKPLTWGNVLEQFGDKWLATREGDLRSSERKKQATLKNYLAILNKSFAESGVSFSEEYNEVSVLKLLSGYGTRTDKRHRVTQRLFQVNTLFNVSVKIPKCKKPPTAVKRNLPTDDEIECNYRSLGEISATTKRQIEASSYYQWVYGVLAAYGLRPQEIFAIDWTQSFRAENDYWLKLDSSQTDGTKTGDRWTAPLKPEWVELFDCATKPTFPTSADLSHRVAQIARHFQKRKIGQPYDLRHAYGVRSKQYMEPIDASSCMGHSVAVHVRVYHSHESFESKLQSVRAGMTRKGH